MKTFSVIRNLVIYFPTNAEWILQTLSVTFSFPYPIIIVSLLQSFTVCFIRVLSLVDCWRWSSYSSVFIHEFKLRAMKIKRFFYFILFFYRTVSPKHKVQVINLSSTSSELCAVLKRNFAFYVHIQLRICIGMYTYLIHSFYLIEETISKEESFKFSWKRELKIYECERT